MPSNPQDLAVEALVEFFQSDAKGRIALYPASSDRDYSAATSTGAGPLDFRILSFGEIVDCLAEVGLLVTPQASSAERSEEDGCRCAPTPSAAPAQTPGEVADVQHPQAR